MELNPFVPTFGVSPQILIGREAILADFASAFSSGPGDPSLSVLITGQRGMGKTVLLDAYELAARENGWVVASESSSPGLLDRLTQDHLPRLIQQISPESRNKVTSRGGSAFNVSYQSGWEERYPAETTLRSQVVELTDYLAERGSGLVITVDEVQSTDAEELRKLGEIVQHARRENRLVGFAAAGLTNAMDEFLSHDGVTFLRRAERYQIGRVELSEVAQAMATTINDAGRTIGDEALQYATFATEGYPYLIQLVGYYCWKQNPQNSEITLADVTKGVADARRRLGQNVHSSAMRGLSESDKTYLMAMSLEEADGKSSTGKVAERLGVSAQHAGVYRSRLLAAGVIEQAGRGYVRFAIPYLGEYLQKS